MNHLSSEQALYPVVKKLGVRGSSMVPMFSRVSTLKPSTARFISELSCLVGNAKGTSVMRRIVSHKRWKSLRRDGAQTVVGYFDSGSERPISFQGQLLVRFDGGFFFKPDVISSFERAFIPSFKVTL